MTEKTLLDVNQFVDKMKNVQGIKVFVLQTCTNELGETKQEQAELVLKEASEKLISLYDPKEEKVVLLLWGWTRGVDKILQKDAIIGVRRIEPGVEYPSTFELMFFTNEKVMEHEELMNTLRAARAKREQQRIEEAAKKNGAFEQHREEERERFFEKLNNAPMLKAFLEQVTKEDTTWIVTGNQLEFTRVSVAQFEASGNSLNGSVEKVVKNRRLHCNEGGIQWHIDYSPYAIATRCVVSFDAVEDQSEAEAV